MKVLSPTAHGVVDYATVVLFGLAPTLFDLHGAYATACYILAAGYLAITLLTDFPMGAVRIIPFPIHGRLELISGLVLLASPFLFGFADDNMTARNLFMAAGVAFLLVWMLTDWRSQTRSMMTDAGRH